MFSLIFVAVGGAVCQAIRGEDFWSFLLCAGAFSLIDMGLRFHKEKV